MISASNAVTSYETRMHARRLSGRAWRFVWQWGAVAIPLAAYVALFIIPVGFIAEFSFRGYAPGGHGVNVAADILSADNYLKVFTPTFRTVFINSVTTALIGTSLCILVGYPVSYFISTRVPERFKAACLAIVIVPFWTSYLLRMIGWQILLGGSSHITAVLRLLGVVDANSSLLYTKSAVLIGLLYNYLPITILPLYVAIDRVDAVLREASKDLGASPSRSFLDVTLPLTSGGISAAAVIVFITMTGDYVTPQLMGGAKGLMIGNLIYSQFLEGEDWPLAAAMSMSLVAVLVVVVLLGLALATLIFSTPRILRRAFL
ncbi:ABC transporter permease [Mesorhizobium sp.]|uniref:ABC transporter permease n=1 Tax=Mesorhizobium sp. TaxID=1871066 RepID=UPI000FE99958|nr:ABC transporter permease [Mesorhizobium sp.]RWI88950.1 MAG: ABC transporter permease [Mesorhizobium sp.]